MIPPNRFLGTSSPLPAATERNEITADLAKYAWPGGYEIVYVTGEGEDLCAECVNKQTADRTEYASVARTDLYGLENITEATPYGPDEVIAGWFSMDQTDSCAYCVECNRFVPASGCDVEGENPGRHGEYCQYENDHAPLPAGG